MKYLHDLLGPLLLLFLSCIVANADESLATSYFPNLTSDEKETYTNWLNEHSPLYPRHTFMSSSKDDDDGAAIFWNISDDDNDMIHFAIAVRAEGWVGFGISEAGGMIGSDLALYTASNPLELVDAYVVEDRSMPYVMMCFVHIMCTSCSLHMLFAYISLLADFYLNNQYHNIIRPIYTD